MPSARPSLSSSSSLGACGLVRDAAADALTPTSLLLDQCNVDARWNKRIDEKVAPMASIDDITSAALLSLQTTERKDSIGRCHPRRLFRAVVTRRLLYSGGG